MDSSDLTPEQVSQLREAIRRQLRYLNRLCGRMQRVCWSKDDPVYGEALRARDAVQRLYLTCFDAGCKPQTESPDA